MARKNMVRKGNGLSRPKTGREQNRDINRAARATTGKAVNRKR